MPRSTLDRIRTYLQKNRLLRQGLIDTNFYFLAQVGSRLVGLFVIPLFARILSVGEFASYDLFILGSSLLVIVSGLGMDSGVAIKVVESKDNPDALRALLFTNLLLVFLSLLVMWGLTIVVMSLGLVERKINAAIIHGLFLYTAIYQYNYVVYNFIRWFGMAGRAAMINFVSYVVGVLGGLAGLLLISYDLSSFVIGAVLASLIGAALTTTQAIRFLQPRTMQSGQFKDFMKLSLPYVPVYLSTYMLQFVDRLLITSTLGMTSLGLYALVSRVGQVITFGLQIVSSGFRPLITSNYENAEGQLLGKRIFAVYSIATLPVTLLAILLAPQIVAVFGGSQFEAAAPLVPPLVFSAWMMGSFYLFGYGFQIRRKTVHITVITLAVVLAFFLFGSVLVTTMGLIGVAFSLSVASALGAVTFVYFSERFYSFGYRIQWMLIAIAISWACLVAARLI